MQGKLVQRGSVWAVRSSSRLYIVRPLDVIQFKDQLRVGLQVDFELESFKDPKESFSMAKLAIA